jgi:hypothetical protein
MMRNSLIFAASGMPNCLPNLQLPVDSTTAQRDQDLHNIHSFLETLTIPAAISPLLHSQFIKRASRYFIHNNLLWRKDSSQRHQLVVFGSDHGCILGQTHDQLGHKGIYATQQTIADHYWWPSLDKDLAWYIWTCHQCQIRSVKHVIIPPTIAIPTPLFQKAFVDSMYMPTARGYTYLVQAHCLLSNWPEWHMLKTETGQTLGAFIFEEIWCRWGGIEEIVTDNSPPFLAAVNWPSTKYHINHI